MYQLSVSNIRNSRNDDALSIRYRLTQNRSQQHSKKQLCDISFRSFVK